MFKRLLDVTVASLALFLLSPLVLFIGLRVRKEFGSPIFFRQYRPGLAGKAFEIIKFRTMNDARDFYGKNLTDERRLTAFGCWLRSVSLDELPELWNVLKGDMSLVGPRPLLMEYLPLYSREQARRHEVRPGITGWAQVNGRDELPIPDKVELDKVYLQRQSWLFDLQILLRTFVKVVRREGVVH